ncbi:ATP-dependent helicase, partial [Candidatus Saccharibacteria bacterium]|nr:ATP-dependent helicase [Candidatus Saccharibacteria bacterium]
AEQNLADAEAVKEAFEDLPPRISPKLQTTLPIFAGALEKLIQLCDKTEITTGNGHVKSYITLLIEELGEAIGVAEETGKTKPLSEFKTKNLKRNSHNKAVLQSETISGRLLSLAGIYRMYSEAMRANGFYDFNDMILRAIHALETHDDLRYTLQERYQFVLLDEYQDTNPDQDRLVRLLTTLPHGDSPNVLSVGDDDQAIMAFQGALSHNLIDFRNYYEGTKQITLKTNYRSHSEILELAEKIITQVPESERAKKSSEKLDAFRKKGADISFKQFKAPLMEYQWVADEIAKIASGDSLASIAVIAPRHEILMDFMPYILEKDLPTEYEKRENILESREMEEILNFCRLINAVSKSLPSNHLWLPVLGIERLGIAPKTILKIASETHEQKISWQKYMLDKASETQDEKLQEVGSRVFAWATALGSQTAKVVIAEIIDYLYKPVEDNFENPGLYNTLSHVTTIWNNLVEAMEKNDFSLGEFLEYVEDCREAGIRVLDKNPFKNLGNAIQVMSAHGSKGLEFDYVFMLNCSENGWNNKRSNNASFPRPENLVSISRANSDEFGRLRLFFVAVTRAKNNLVMTYSENDRKGGDLDPIGFLNGIMEPEKVEIDEKSLRKNITKGLLYQWMEREESSVDVNVILQEKVARFRMSASSFLKYLDLDYAGPDVFKADLLFAMPKIFDAKVELGNVTHNALDYYGKFVKREGRAPDDEKLAGFIREYIENKTNLRQDRLEEYSTHCLGSLKDYVAFAPSLFLPETDDVSEVAISTFWNGVQITGRIDYVLRDDATKILRILDFKTGEPHAKYSDSKLGLYKYRWQLYFYKLLLENDKRYAGYRVVGGSLNFTARDAESGMILPPIEFEFDEKLDKRFRDLLKIVSQRVKKLDFSRPDEAELRKRSNGMMSFEDYLLGE